MDMTCIEDVDESEIFDENINSIFHCRVNNVVIVPISSDRTDGLDQFSTNKYESLGYIMLINNKGGAESCLKQFNPILNNIASQIHKSFFEDDYRNKIQQQNLEQIKKLNVQLGRHRKERELTKQRIEKETERFERMKIELKAQLSNERDKVTEEIRTKLALKEGWEQLENSLKTKMKR